AARAVREASSATPAPLGADFLVRTKAREVTASQVGYEHDITAIAAVASVRPAARDELLPAEVDRAVAPAARDCRESRPVVEHESSYASTTEMKRRSPLVRNATLPSRIAKIVSSLPIPVPGPGRKRVPRWRTRIIPDETSWPANIFTPSICGFESRPFRDEPNPFLCAISSSPQVPIRARRSRPCAPYRPARP